MTKKEINLLTVKWLIDNYKITVDAALLYVVAEEGNRDLCEAFLECGINPNLVEGDDDSALHIAAWNTHKEVVQLLLKFGANPNYLPHDNDDCFTPFDYAIQQGNLEIVKLMIEAGANVNRKVCNLFVWDADYAEMNCCKGKAFDSVIAYVKEVAERQKKK